MNEQTNKWTDEWTDEPDNYNDQLCRSGSITKIQFVILVSKTNSIHEQWKY